MLTPFRKLGLRLFALTLWVNIAPSVFAIIGSSEQHWLRLDDPVSNVQVSPRGRYFAFLKGRQGLFVLDSKSKEIYLVSAGEFAARSFFWSPVGQRLFYQERRVWNGGNKEISIHVYDTFLKKDVKVESIPSSTSFLTLDPRTLRINFLNEAGKILGRKLEFPDSRLAKWQRSTGRNGGFWIAAPNGIVWIDSKGLAMNRLDDDGAAVNSFDISPDGQVIVWCTDENRIYRSREGLPSEFVDYGLDPRWHSEKSALVYSGARMIGRTPSGYDLRFVDADGRKKWLTNTPYSDERWPLWLPGSSKIVYTKDRTTDLFTIDVDP